MLLVAITNPSMPQNPSSMCPPQPTHDAARCVVEDQNNPMDFHSPKASGLSGLGTSAVMPPISLAARGNGSSGDIRLLHDWQIPLLDTADSLLHLGSARYCHIPYHPTPRLQSQCASTPVPPRSLCPSGAGIGPQTDYEIYLLDMAIHFGQGAVAGIIRAAISISGTGYPLRT